MSSRIFSLSRQHLLVCAALSTALISLSGHVFAAPAGATIDVAAQKKTSTTEAQIFGEHHQRKPLSAAERKPRQATQLTARLNYDLSTEKKADLLKRPSKLLANQNKVQASGINLTAALAATCDRQVFANASGATLVNAVKASSTDCINDLFGATGAQAFAIFKEAQMVTIANAFNTAAASYNGTNSGSTLQLVMFLRAGYFVQYYDSAVGAYGSNLQVALRGAMDAFVANGNFSLVNDVHGETLSEFVTLVDSAGENARYLTSVVKRLLNSYNSSYGAFYWMKAATNNAFNVLFRGHQNADFKALVLADPSIIDTLYNFVNSNFNMLGGADDYLVSNAGRELGRFLQYADGTPLKNLAKQRAKNLIDSSNVTGTTASLWVGVGDMVDTYDKANCSYYSICDFAQRLETNVLPIKYSCSPTLRLRAQALTSAQLQEACTTVGGEESYFHKQVNSGNIPVANDNNTQLEMVIFNSSKDYGTYAGAIFGIDTNNGGMYLEGDPAVVGNQPRFIAYQAEWLLPKFEIWNLTHEYVHYLDGRFDMYGDFTAAVSVNSIWWIEGFAEYMSYSYRKVDYPGARTQAAAGTFKLSEIFKNDYSSGQTRVYNWGYLSVRYMFEKQRNRVTSLLGYFRPGNYTGYTSYMGSVATSLDSDFKNWLPCVNDASLPNCAVATNSPPVANFSSLASNLQVNFTDLSTDSDGSISSRSWNFGDGGNASSANPSHTYATAGNYTVTLTVTDNAGASTAISKVVSVTVVPVNTLPVASFSNSISGLSVNFSDTSTDSDGTIASRSWAFGDGTSSTAINPAKTYAASGTYHVTLTVTDNRGGKGSISKDLLVQTGGNFPECGGVASALGQNCVRSNLSGRAGDYVYMYLYVPAGTKQIKFTTSGGSGNADLFINTLGSWATRDYYNYGSYTSSNNETITVNNPPVGYIYISLYGQAAFSGVKVLTQY